MTNAILPYFLILIAYFIGSIPFGVLVAKARGVDLQNVGSKNVGASNVFRSVGKMPALLTLLGDALKGTAAVILCVFMIGRGFWESVIGIAVVLGHMYSIFLSFSVGNVVATSLGVLAVYSPFPAIILIIIWVLTAIFTKYSSLASITAFISLPVIFVLLETSKEKISFAIVLTFLITLKHGSNIKRLFGGTETKIGEKVRF